MRAMKNCRGERPRERTRAGPTKLPSIYCVFSKVRSKADGKLQTAGITGFNAQHPPGSWHNASELEPTTAEGKELINWLYKLFLALRVLEDTFIVKNVADSNKFWIQYMFHFGYCISVAAYYIPR